MLRLRVSIQAVCHKKKKQLMVHVFFSVLQRHTVGADSIKTSASLQSPQPRPSLCLSPGGS